MGLGGGATNAMRPRGREFVHVHPDHADCMHPHQRRTGLRTTGKLSTTVPAPTGRAGEGEGGGLVAAGRGAGGWEPARPGLLWFANSFMIF